MTGTGAHAGTAALVTGGSQGIGRAIAEALIADGCRQITIAGRDPAKGDAAARDLAALMDSGGEARFVPVEMGDTASVRAMVAQAADLMGRVDALVNAAGLSNRGGILDADQAVWDLLMNVNARGPFFAMQEIARRAVAAGRPTSIVNILSTSLHVGQSFLAPYAASKAALATLTRNAAQTLRGQHIRVNAIAPGWMDTAGEDAVQRNWHDAPADWLARAEAAQPFGMLVKPAHVARLAAYMLGPESGVMTGAVVDFDQFVPGATPE